MVPGSWYRGDGRPACRREELQAGRLCYEPAPVGIRGRSVMAQKARTSPRAPSPDGGMASAPAPELLRKIDAYWRAANYLSVGQIYLFDNPLLREPLQLKHIKPRLLGHWGTTPGLNFVYVHINRIIKQYELNMIFVTGPGHGGPGLVANTYLEGSYSEV